MALTPGSRLGPYQIVAPLGAGGMGEVYRAHDERLGRDLALKVLPPNAMADETARSRLVREARMASSLNHPHIAHIYDVGEDQGHLFIGMELVEGRTLRELIAQDGVPPESLLPYGLQIAEALAYAHQRGVIHRDLKSANVMVTPEGWIKVLDFGLAKRIHEEANLESRHDLSVTASGVVLGTPMYLPPEVILGAKSDARSDVWALGVVLYEMATGKLPFAGGSMGALADSIVNAAPSPISGRVDVGLRGVIQRCLAKEPDARYQQGAEACSALEALDRRGGRRGAAPGRRRLWLAAAAVLVLAAVLGAAIGLGRLRIPGVASSTPKSIRALAVLPLANLSGDPDQEYFANGMTEELITGLASIRTLTVISRTSVMRYKNTQKSLREIAEELGVDGIIEGSVLRAGDRVRITAQLIEAAKDRHLWARSYERDFKDVLSLQSEVARDIVKEIQLQLSPRETGRLAQHPQVDPEAYDLYLKGRYEWGKITEEGVRKGIEYFEKALARDPSDARYSSGLADAYLVQMQIFGTLAPQEGMPKVKKYALRALAADDQSAEAHASMGAALFFGDWDWEEAELHLIRSIELKPSYSTGHTLYSVVLGATGRIREAIVQDSIALQTDPLSLLINWHAAGTLYHARRYSDALAQAKRAFRVDPKSMLGQSAPLPIYEQQGNYKAAIELLERFLPESEGRKGFVATLRRAYAESGATGYWRTVLERAREEQSRHGPNPIRLAMIYARLGDRDRAIEHLERAYAQHSTDILFINVEPCFDSLRSDPRFQALVRRVGLTPRA